MSTLAAGSCVACHGGAEPIRSSQFPLWLAQVPGWHLIEREGIPRLERVYTFRDFAAALQFTNRVGALAEEQGHHPALLTEWGRVTVSWWTHAIGGLHRNDFIMAAKTDELASPS